MYYIIHISDGFTFGLSLHVQLRVLLSGYATHEPRLFSRLGSRLLITHLISLFSIFFNNNINYNYYYYNSNFNSHCHVTQYKLRKEMGNKSETPWNLRTSLASDGAKILYLIKSILFTQTL